MDLDLATILGAFLSNENSVRTEAESRFAALKQTNPRDVIIGLIKVVSSDLVHIRLLSIVLLRGFTIREKALWDAVPPEEVTEIRQFLLKGLEAESSPHIRNKLVDCVAANAKLKEWPELFGLVSNLAASGEVDSILLSLQLIEKLGEYIGPQLLQYLEALMGMIRPALVSDNVQIRAKATTALLSLLFDMQEPTEQVLEAVAVGIDVIRDLVLNQGSMDQEAHVLLDLVHQIAEQNPNIFYGSKSSLFNFLIEAIRAKTELDIKVVVLETLSELIATKKSSFYRDQAQGLLTLSMELMQSQTSFGSEDDQDGCSNLHTERPSRDGKYDDSFGSDVDTCMSESALECFQRMAEVMRPSEVVNLGLGVASKLISDASNWRSRRTAMVITSVLCDECGEALRPYAPQLVQPIVTALEDPSLRVRYGALYVLGSFAETFIADDEDEESFQDKYHASVLPAILNQLIVMIHHPYLLHRGLSTLRLFLDNESCKRQIIVPSYDGQIIEFLIKVASDDSFPYFVKEEAFTTLTNTFVLARREVLEQFYPQLMPMYINAINAISSGTVTNQQDYDLSRVIGRCLESFAIYAKHVDFDSVRDATMALVRAATTILCSSSSDNLCDYTDPLTSYVSESCVRLAGVMGDSFQPFLVNVIPALLFHISEDLPMDILFGDDDMPPSPSQSPNLLRSPSPGGSDVVFTKNFRGYGNVRLQCNTYLMTERESSCRVLLQYLSDLPHLMWPYTPDITQVVSDVSMLFLSTDGLFLTLGCLISDSIMVFLLHCRTSPTFPMIDTSSLSIVDSPQRSVEASQMMQFMAETGMKFFLSNLQQSLELPDAENVIIEKDLQKTHDLVDCIRETLLVLYNHWHLCYPPSNEPLSGDKPAPPPGVIITDAALEDIINTVSKISGLWVRNRFRSDTDYTERDDDLYTENNLWMSLIDIIGWLGKLCPLQMERSKAFAEFVILLRERLNTSLLKISSNVEVVREFIPLITMSVQITCDVLDSTSLDIYSEPFAESILQLSPLDEDTALMCANAVGIAAMCAPDEFDAHVQRSVVMLYSFLGTSSAGSAAVLPQDADDEFKEKIADISLMSLFKFCIYRSDQLGPGTSQVLINVLSQLPILNQYNLIESRMFHRLFVSLVAAQDVRLFGANMEHGQFVFSILQQLQESVDLNELKLLNTPTSASIMDSSCELTNKFWNEQLVDDETFNVLSGILDARRKE